MNKILIVLISVAALLSGCGSPTSNSTGSDQATQGGFESAVHWAKKIVHGWTTKASVQIPAQGLIADALVDQKFLGDGYMPPSIVREMSSTFAKNNFKSTLQKLGPGAEGANNYLLLMPATVVNAPYRGWEISMIDQSVFGGSPEATHDEVKAYLGFQEASVEYTNNLFTEIATRLNDDVGVVEDPTTAKNEIRRIFKSIPKSTLKKLWVDAVASADTRQRTIDLSGTKGVDWSADGGSYSGNGDGLVWEKSGIVWYGKGALSGKQWTIGLESSIAKTLDKSTDGSESVSGSIGEKSSEGVEPK